MYGEWDAQSGGYEQWESLYFSRYHGSIQQVKRDKQYAEEKGHVKRSVEGQEDDFVVIYKYSFLCGKLAS